MVITNEIRHASLKSPVAVYRKKSTVPILGHPEVEDILPKPTPTNEAGQIQIRFHYLNF